MGGIVGSAVAEAVGAEVVEGAAVGVVAALLEGMLEDEPDTVEVPVLVVETDAEAVA